MSSGRSPAEMMAFALEMDVELLPFASELLADFNELGSDRDLIVDVLADLGVTDDSLVIDLGCGKGAVSIEIARRLGARVIGIDLHDGLVADARTSAVRAGVAGRCQWIVGDIVAMAGALEPADAVVFAALGHVLGPLDHTMGIIREYVRVGGHIVLNDDFITNADAVRFDGFEQYGSLHDTRARLVAFGDSIVREVVETTDDGRAAIEADLIEARARGLAERRPELAAVLERFAESQREEYEFLDTAMTGAVWALQRCGTTKPSG